METVPQGAIWIKNFKLRQSVSNFISTRNVECPKCHSHFQDPLSEVEENDLNESIVNHVMTVKVKAMREKYIAIFNPKKSLSTHPDYYLFVYQAYTGAPSVYPFAVSQSSCQEGTTQASKGSEGARASSNTQTVASYSQGGAHGEGKEKKD